MKISLAIQSESKIELEDIHITDIQRKSFRGSEKSSQHGMVNVTEIIKSN